MKRMTIMFLTLLLLLAACGGKKDNDKKVEAARRAASQKTLRMAVMPTLDCLPLFLAQDKQWFDTTKVDLRLTTFTAQMDCDTAFAGSSADATVSDLFRIERLRKRGTDAEYFTRTNAYWLLLADRSARVKSISQMGDKMIAMTRYSVTDYLTDQALSKFKMKNPAYKVQINSVSVRLQMFQNHEMDAAWFTEPQATLAKFGNPSLLNDSRKMKVRAGVIAFHKSYMSEGRRMDAFREGYNRACDSLAHFGLNHYAETLKKHYGLKTNEIKSLPKLEWEHANLPTKADVATAERYVPTR